MKSKISTVAAMFVGAMLLNSCLSDGDSSIILQSEPVVTLPTGPQTGVVSTGESATISSNGYTLMVPRNSVPATNSGSDGKVAFSMSPEEYLPASMPSGITLIENTCVKAEPMNFTFSSPLVLSIPTGNNDPSDLVLLRYNESTGNWDYVPFSCADANGNVQASVIELGIFAVGKKTGQHTSGGIRISRSHLDRNYVYYLTLISGSSMTTKQIAYADNDNDLFMGGIPLGEYTVKLTRQLRRGLEGVPETIESYPDIYVNVLAPLVKGNGGYGSYSGWTVISLSGSSWYSGRPDSAWGVTTTSYGTGAFQATLTWINTESSVTDVDLHLEGPAGLHVFYGNKNEGGFELDRDWTSPLGNAIENIYSVADLLPGGEYAVKVHHYSGALGKRYNCRVILNGVVVKSISGTLTSSGQYDTIHTFTIEE